MLAHSIARRDCLIGIGSSALILASGARAAPPEGPHAVPLKYFRLINQRRFYAAFHVWELEIDGRNAAGQTLKAFTAGFAQTRSVSAEIGAEGEGDSGAGSEYMPLTVTLSATLKSGRKQLFEGNYTMRHSLNPDGHRDWLIYAAQMTPADRN